MLERYTESQTWYIVFDRCYGKAWWKWFLHPKFQHVHVARENRGNTLVVSSMAHVIAVREYANSIEDYMAQELAQNPTAVLMMTVHYGSFYKHAPIEPLTCVSVVKRLLGIDTRCLTPKKLYHECIKAGATVIKPYCIM